MDKKVRKMKVYIAFDGEGYVKGVSLTKVEAEAITDTVEEHFLEHSYFRLLECIATMSPTLRDWLRLNPVVAEEILYVIT